MRRLSREKRNQLITVIVITVGVLALIGFGLIRSQYDSLSRVAKTEKTAKATLLDIKHAITNSEAIANDWDEVSNALAHEEDDMASGDFYSWTYDTIRHFKQSYKVEIPEVGHPTTSESDLLPAFPYKQIQFVIDGTVYYHDLGKFIADFENSFPHSRIARLVIEPVTDRDNSGEKLTFKMEIITLIKPNPL